MTWSNPQALGTVNGSPIIAELGPGLHPEGAVTVTLTADYTMASLPGFPSRPPCGSSANMGLPQTLANGTAHQFLKPEADALIAAGAATLA